MYLNILCHLHNKDEKGMCFSTDFYKEHFLNLTINIFRNYFRFFVVFILVFRGTEAYLKLCFIDSILCVKGSLGCVFDTMLFNTRKQ